MVWARVALAVGLLLVCAAFAFGTEVHRSTSVMGQSLDCGASISPSWLVPGTPDQTSLGAGATAEERRLADACRPVIQQSRVVILAIMGVGGLLALVGGTVIRERRELEPRQATPVHA